ncbi:hypothetical protein MTO96_042862 [Rhipicephalus appendiculatus]
MMTKASEEGKDRAVVLLNYPSTPTIGGNSPAELLMGRKLSTFLPTLPSVLQPSFPTIPHHALLHERQKQQHKHGDSLTRNLLELNPGQPVWLHLNQKWEKATVVNVGPEPRRYAVKKETGGILFRNRIHLRPRTPQQTVAEASPQDYDIAEPSLPVPTQQVEERPRPPQTPASEEGSSLLLAIPA